MDVVSAILMERRVLFVSSSLSSLSKTVHAIMALIYPFRWAGGDSMLRKLPRASFVAPRHPSRIPPPARNRWQHIFLPIIPEGLLDYLQAPMPWIAGLPRQFLPHLAKVSRPSTRASNRGVPEGD
jgi:hypothetical protein